jgi:hypothetical protein
MLQQQEAGKNDQGVLFSRSSLALQVSQWTWARQAGKCMCKQASDFRRRRA